MNVRLYLKIGLVIGLMIILMIPLAMIGNVVYERSNYRDQVAHEVSQTWTGQQNIGGPVLTVPYQVRYEDKTFNKETKKYETVIRTQTKKIYVIADELNIVGEVATENRQRGIYSVPVYTSDLKLSGNFPTSGLLQIEKNQNGFVRWLSPSLSLMIDDVRGLGSSPQLLINNQQVDFEAGSTVPNLTQGLHSTLREIDNKKPLNFEISYQLRGSNRLMVAPLAKDVKARLSSSWPHPKFTGDFLPMKHEISQDGFVADWQTSVFSTDAEKRLERCITGDCSELFAMRFGAEFIDPVDIYDKVLRAAKYGILFIVLTFVAFFLTETLSATTLHPVQYCLVGSALAIFYLLLVSLSEHMGFFKAYFAATIACTLLITIYMGGVLSNIKQGLIYGSGIAGLYAMLYNILRSEDFALLMGSLLLFLVLASVMIMTRRINWYEVGVPNDLTIDGIKQ